MKFMSHEASIIRFTNRRLQILRTVVGDAAVEQCGSLCKHWSCREASRQVGRNHRIAQSQPAQNDGSSDRPS